MKGRRRVFLLICVLFISINVFAPNLSKKDVEQSFYEYYRRLNRERVEIQQREEMEKFLKAIGHSESRNNPEAWNRFGYIGKYQFGYAARKSCGFEQVKFDDFIKNPSVWSEEDQDAAMIMLLSKNEESLKDIIHAYNGMIINEGDTITTSGILAAAHLAGASGVRSYFKYGKNPKDAYGTGLEDYLVEFSGFNI